MAVAGRPNSDGEVGPRTSNSGRSSSSADHSDAAPTRKTARRQTSESASPRRSNVPVISLGRIRAAVRSCFGGSWVFVKALRDFVGVAVVLAIGILWLANAWQIRQDHETIRKQEHLSADSLFRDLDVVEALERVVRDGDTCRWLGRYSGLVQGVCEIEVLRLLPFMQSDKVDLILLDLRRIDLSCIRSSVAGDRCANLRGWNLSKSRLWRSRLAGIDLSEAILHSTDFKGSYMADSLLRKAHLCEADLTRTDLSDADLGGARMKRARLAAATLAGANLVKVKASSTLFQGADLTDANLVGACLVRAQFYGADLTDADLSEATLKGTHFVSAKLVGTVFTGATIDADTVFTYADLTGADFSGVQGMDGRHWVNICTEDGDPPRGIAEDKWHGKERGADFHRDSPCHSVSP